MKLHQTTEQSIDAQIRRVIAQAIEDRSLVDVSSCAEIIAFAHGLPRAKKDIETALAESGLAARVPMKLPATPRINLVSK